MTDEQIKKVFDHWNSYKGRKVPKRSNKKCWWSCELSEGKVPFDVRKGIKEALKHYSLDEIKKAIDNYALVLLNKDYKWSYVWKIAVFFSVKYEKRMDGDKKWWQFLPHNFDKESLLAPGVMERRTMRQPEPEPPPVFDKDKVRSNFAKFLKSVPPLPKRGAAQREETEKL